MFSRRTSRGESSGRGPSPVHPSALGGEAARLAPTAAPVKDAEVSAVCCGLGSVLKSRQCAVVSAVCCGLGSVLWSRQCVAHASAILLVCVCHLGRMRLPSCSYASALQGVCLGRASPMPRLYYLPLRGAAVVPSSVSHPPMLRWEGRPPMLHLSPKGWDGESEAVERGEESRRGEARGCTVSGCSGGRVRWGRVRWVWQWR